uniref:Uncharacterized protein n=1 Tax=Anguilla anguilla TaxID=7936 RepID=A0A0E9Q3T4_ANGAN
MRRRTRRPSRPRDWRRCRPPFLAFLRWVNFTQTQKKKSKSEVD